MAYQVRIEEKRLLDELLRIERKKNKRVQQVDVLDDLIKKEAERKGIKS